MINLVPANTVIKKRTGTYRNIQSEHTATFKEGDFLLFNNVMAQSY